MSDRTLYEILEVSENATPQAIRAAYERLSTQLDPNRGDQPASEELEELRVQYAAVREAFFILANAERRAQYDKSLIARVAGSAHGVEPFWTLPKLALAVMLVVGLGAYYYQAKQEQMRLAVEKEIAAAKAKEAEAAAAAEVEQARIEHERNLARLAEERAQRENEAAIRRIQQEQNANATLQARIVERDRRMEQHAEQQRRLEEARATAAARQQLARERAELCRMERERYGRAYSC
jgi:curved DNA-binding protein CbpA